MSRARAVLLAVLPLAILAAGEIAGLAARRAGDAEVRARLEARATRVEASFREIVDGADRLARCVLERGVEAAPECRRGPVGARLEGAGITAASGRPLVWTGTPVDPPSAGTVDVRVRGHRSSLVVRTPPAADGRSAFASFTLDAPALALPFASLARGLVRGDGDRVSFGRPRGEAPPPEGAWSRATLAAPDGTLLGEVLLTDPAPEALAVTRARIGRALAAAAFLALLVLLPPWGAWTRSRAGLVAAVAALLAGRLLASEALVLERLLPRSIGSPSLFGSARGLGWLGSPAALLLTGVAVVLAALALRSLVRHGGARPRSLFAGVATLAAVAGGVGVDALGQILARDARIPVLRLADALASPGHAVLLAGLVAVLVGVAILAGTAWNLLAGRSSGPSAGDWIRVEAPCLLALSLVASAGMARASDRLALERVRSEYAPQVLDQTARRQVALQSAVRESAQSPVALAALRAAPGDAADAAWSLWLEGDLFHRGYLSSLDLVDERGARRSHFAFGLPPLVDFRAPGAAWDLRGEDFPIGAETRRLWHAEMPVFSGDTRLGAVVGHVLEEPDNLPFLPGVAPYLSALGPGGPSASGPYPGPPEYVLYDRSGAIVHTIGQPPADGPELRAAARSGEPVRLTAGGLRYRGLALEDDRGLHVLLVPDRSWLDELGGFFRVALLALLGLGGVAIATRARKPGALGRLANGLGGSFYRKILASLLAASVVPVVGLAVFVRGYVERRSESSLESTAAATAGVVRRVVEDYAAEIAETRPDEGINDAVLAWLRRVVGQEIHLYADGLVRATSKPELFDSGLLSPRLPGDVHRDLVVGRLPFSVRRARLGGAAIPVAYARVALPGPPRDAVVAVPLVVEQQELERSVGRVIDALLLATVLLAGALAAAAAWLAGTVARPVGALVHATTRIAAGDYGARIAATTRDEIAALVEAFNRMAASLAAQRADLERRADYIEALVTHATTGVVSTDAEGRVVTVNPAARRLLGIDAGGAEGVPLLEVVSTRPRLEPLAGIVSGAPPGSGEPREVDVGAPGAPRRLQVVRVTLPDASGGAAGALWLLDDVTDLTRSNQLAAWAEMARAIAHEIKNPLTPIQLSTEHLERVLADRGVAPHPEIRACLETILKQVRALREIAGEFSAYAKLPDLAPVPSDAGDFLAEVLAPYRAAPPPGIEIREHRAPAPPVALDRRVMARAVVNLIENALQAMPGGGTLSLASGLADGFVVLSVSDTGPGLDPEARARLFEPYFSTKSSGTGLGLGIVRRAVEAHGGRIEVDSERGRGTTFRIALPPARPA